MPDFAETKGTKRVALRFNPSEMVEVTAVKETCAALIDNLDAIETDDPEVHRWKAEAMTLIETGCMFAVKALVHTK